MLAYRRKVCGIHRSVLRKQSCKSSICFRNKKVHLAYCLQKTHLLKFVKWKKHGRKSRYTRQPFLLSLSLLWNLLIRIEKKRNLEKKIQRFFPIKRINFHYLAKWKSREIYQSSVSKTTMKFVAPWKTGEGERHGY